MLFFWIIVLLLIFSASEAGWVEIELGDEPNLLVIISGPSGSGKTSTVDHIAKKKFETQEYELFRNVIRRSTTRDPREGEVNGIDYLFVSKEELENAKLVERVEYIDNIYGITKKEFQKRITQGPAVIITNLEGKKQLKNVHSNTLSIYLSASKEELEKRLNKRGKDNHATIRRRMDLYDQVIETKKEYDVVIEVDGKTMDEVSEEILYAVRKKILSL